MEITLKRNKKGKVRTRKYNRIKPLKAQYRAMRSTIYIITILTLLGILIYTITHAKSEYTIEFRDVVRERVILVEKVDQDDIAEKICNKYELAKTCRNDLKAMRGIESQGGQQMIGDDGKSIGWYQIQTKLHEITQECALDYSCSTEWTVKNLLKNGYNTNRKLALTKHNGVVKGSTYASRVITLSNKFNY